MKYGKVYDYSNAEEARHLIGKKVAVSDIYREINENPEADKIVVLDSIAKEDEWPFISAKQGWQFIREIEEESPKRMTYRQLSEWIARGNGEFLFNEDDHEPQSHFSYEEQFVNTEVPEYNRIRPWGSEDWIVPTREIYERDCKGEGR